MRQHKDMVKDLKETPNPTPVIIFLNRCTKDKLDKVVDTWTELSDDEQKKVSDAHMQADDRDDSALIEMIDMQVLKAKRQTRNLNRSRASAQTSEAASSDQPPSGSQTSQSRHTVPPPPPSPKDQRATASETEAAQPTSEGEAAASLAPGHKTNEMKCIICNAKVVNTYATGRLIAGYVMPPEGKLCSKRRAGRHLCNVFGFPKNMEEGTDNVAAVKALFLTFSTHALKQEKLEMAKHVFLHLKKTRKRSTKKCAMRRCA